MEHEARSYHERKNVRVQQIRFNVCQRRQFIKKYDAELQAFLNFSSYFITIDKVYKIFIFRILLNFYGLIAPTGYKDINKEYKKTKSNRTVVYVDVVSRILAIGSTENEILFSLPLLQQ